MGDPLLYQVAEAVTGFGSPTLHALIQDMFDTMAACNGAGLAAPQIGVSTRVVVFGIESNSRYPDAEPVPTTVLINPVIEVIGTARDAQWEGCLSVPGLRGLVERPAHIRYRGFDVNGESIEREARDFHARVVQHECDHLDGILYPMRVRDPRLIGYEGTLMFPNLHQGEPEPG